MSILENSDTVLFLILVLFKFSHYNAQQNGDSICQQKKLTGYTCRNWNECPSGGDLIQSRKAVQCGVSGKIPKLCCPPSTETKNSTPVTPKVTNVVTPTATTPKSVTSVTSSNSNAIVEQKCNEYREYRYVNKTVLGQYLGEPSKVVKEPDCVRIEQLIVGGTKTELKEYPHMALIGYRVPYSNVFWGCGGSLISERFVLSAAHCGNTQYGEARWVRLGDLNITSDSDKAMPRVYSIVQRYDHPGYNPPIVYNDITLFRLNATVVFSPFIRPTCLPTSNLVVPAGSKVSITGWGLTGTIERRSDHLLKATIFLVNARVCNASYGNDPKLNRGFDANTMLCAGDSSTGKDTCSGDSGGPLQTLIQNDFCMWRQIGITSIGPGICGDKENPAVYTKISSYIDWIQRIVWP